VSYAPLIRPDDIIIQANPFARTLGVNELLQKCFDSEILPDRAKNPRFNHSDILSGLYISNRTWSDEVDYSDAVESHHHEAYLDYLFWNDDPETSVICLLGNVGSGKSTFIDYYLRCYGPNASYRRADFDRTIIVFFDAKDILDNNDFYHDFFLFAQASIRSQCTDKFDIDYAIKRRPTQPNNIREWVWAAFEELSRQPKQNESPLPFQHIVLVIDNLDQAHPAVQIRAIAEVEHWLRTPTIRLYRVFLPLWPSTYNYLRNSRYNLLRRSRVFRIGQIDTQILIENHEQAIDQALQNTNAILNPMAREYLVDMTRLAKERLVPRIRELSNGNLRRMLSLWGGFLRSDLAYSLWRHTKAAPESRRRSYEYELLDALIVGAYDVLNHRTYRVANVFAMWHSYATPRDFLIGFHSLHLLARGEHAPRTLAAELEPLGYSSQKVDQVLEEMNAFNLLHDIPVRGGLVDFELHPTVIEEYLNHLLGEPAYLDNVAMVTPVTPTVRESMQQTRGDRLDQFTTRVETSLHFLRFLRECEDQFRDPEQLPHNLDPDRFRKALREVRLPCLWIFLAQRYRERLRALQVSGYLRYVESDWWDRTLYDPIFVAIDGTCPSLLPS
jgi:hypothetical protein